jgi:hypothetical protein
VLIRTADQPGVCARTKEVIARATASGSCSGNA